MPSRSRGGGWATTTRRFGVVPAACLALAAGVACGAGQVLVGEQPQTVADRFVPEVPGMRVTTWVSHLDTPWSLVFLPDGRPLVSERPGAIRVIDHGRLLPTPLVTRTVVQDGEGGLMGLALHPRFPEQPYLYAMETIELGGLRQNRVVRFRLSADGAAFDRIILGGIPGGINHNGGRLAFGPDGRLYVTAGEAFRAPLAQDLTASAARCCGSPTTAACRPTTPFPARPSSPTATAIHRASPGTRSPACSWSPSTARPVSMACRPSTRSTCCSRAATTAGHLPLAPSTGRS